MVKQLTSEQLMNWDDLVVRFMKICRILEVLVERGHDEETRKRLFEIIWSEAHVLDDRRKNNDLKCASKFTDYDAQLCYNPPINTKNSIRDLSAAFYDAQDLDNTKRRSRAKGGSSGELPSTKENPPFFIEDPEAFFRKKVLDLQTFFGIQYDAPDWTEQQKFQICQLLQILGNCEVKYKSGILKRIQHPAFGRFRQDEGNPYFEVFQFVKSELLKQISFIDAAQLEYFAGSINHCIHSLAEAIVNRIPIQGLRYSIEDVKNDLYPLILKKLQKCNENEETFFQNPEDLFVRAYLNFLLFYIADGLEEPALKFNLDDLHEGKPRHVCLYFKLEWWKKKLEKDKAYLSATDAFDKTVVFLGAASSRDTVESFVVYAASIIAQIIWDDDDITDKASRSRSKHNHRQKIERHSATYHKLALLYLLYNRKVPPYSISLDELITLIYLFEKCGLKRVTKRSGYNGGKTGKRDRTLYEVITNWKKECSLNMILKDDEPGWYEMVCFLNTLNSLLNNETSEGVRVRLLIKKELFSYLKKVVPVFKDQPRKYNNITDIAESIISTETLGRYRDDLAIYSEADRVLMQLKMIQRREEWFKVIKGE